MTDDEYWSKVKDMQRPELLKLWSDVVNGDTPDWPAGKAFEYLVARAFDLDIDRATEALVPPYRHFEHIEGMHMPTEQVDGVLHCRFASFLLESKDTNQPLDIEVVAKLRFRLESRPPTAMGMIFSMSGFTKPARYFAGHLRPLNILLWERDDLDYALVRERGMLELTRDKLRHAVEYGSSYYAAPPSDDSVKG